jgi:carboxylesterase
VLCLHGLTGTPWEVRLPAEALVLAGFACHGPLLPGHGTDPGDLSRVSRAAWRDAVLRAFDALAATHRSVSVMGLSLGGLLALSVCAARSVRSAVVLAAPLRFGPLTRLGVGLLAPLGVSVPKTPGIADPDARSAHPGYPRMPLRAVRELCALQREVESALPRVEAPLRLIYSRADPTVASTDAERILARVGSRERGVHYLERSSHVLPVDLERDRVARLTVEFVRGVEAGDTAAPAPSPLTPPKA